MMRLLFQGLSPAGPRGRLSILIFHRVLREPDPLFPGEMHAARFDQVCGWLRRWFQVLPLAEAVRALAARRLPARALAITFDDGYADNHDVALPILQRHGLTATFFIASGFLDGGRMWNDTVIEAIRRSRRDALDLACLEDGEGAVRVALDSIEARRRVIEQVIGRTKYLPPARRDRAVAALAREAGVALPDDLMMRSGQVRALRRAGMGVGGHTVTHPIIAGLGDEAIREEVSRGKQDLERILDAPVTLFAYPNGKPGRDYDARCVRIVQECGFEAAVTTAPGSAGAGCDLYQLPRFTPWDRHAWRYGLRLARNLRQDGLRVA